jgi:hypothetical protein
VHDVIAAGAGQGSIEAAGECACVPRASMRSSEMHGQLTWRLVLKAIVKPLQ